MKKKMMGLLGFIALCISIGLIGCKKVSIGERTSNITSCHDSVDNPCGPGIPRGPRVPVIDLAAPDLATPDLATPDLATPDLATPDLWMPDMNSPPNDMTGGNAVDLVTRNQDSGQCQSNNLYRLSGYINDPPCGGNCARRCQNTEGCVDDSECDYDDRYKRNLLCTTIFPTQDGGTGKYCM